MTAPVQPQQPQATQFAPRQFAGRRASGSSGGGFSQNGAITGSSQGDGSQQANGLSSMPQQPRQWQTSQPPQASSTGGAQPTFAQMQANGQARPAPQQLAQPVAPLQQPVAAQNTSGGIDGQLQSAVSNALSNPSRYDLPQVQQVQSALTSQLQQQFGAQQKQLDEQMAARGIGSSSLAAGYNGDLAGQQSTALANMDASLIQNAAQTNAQDLTASLGAGQAYQTGQQNYVLGQGTLANQQQQTTNQASQFGQTFGLSQLQNQQQYGLQQQAQQLAQTLGLGNLGVSQEQVANQASQFGQTLGQNQSQFAASLAQALQLGQMSDATQNRGLDIEQQQGNNTLLEELAMMGIGGGAAGLAGLGSVGGVGSTGGASGTSGSGAAGSGLGTNSQIAASLMQNNPALYAMLYPNATVNYGGQQYTSAQWAQYVQANSSALMNSGDASNSAFFAANAQRAAGIAAQQQQQQQQQSQTQAAGAGGGSAAAAPAANQQWALQAAAQRQSDPVYQQLAAMTPAQQQSTLAALQAKYSGGVPGQFGTTIYSPEYAMSSQDPAAYQQDVYLQQLLGPQTNQPAQADVDAYVQQQKSQAAATAQNLSDWQNQVNWYSGAGNDPTEAAYWQAKINGAG